MILAAIHNYLIEHRSAYDWEPQWHNSEMIRIASLNASLPLYYVEYLPDHNTIEIVIVSPPDHAHCVNVIDLCDTEILNRLSEIIPA